MNCTDPSVPQRVASRTQIFIIRDQDREVLVNKTEAGAKTV